MHGPAPAITLLRHPRDTPADALEATMFHADQSTEDLDPRRRQRGLIRRDWMSGTRSVSVPRIHDLLTAALVRLGLVR